MKAILVNPSSSDNRKNSLPLGLLYIAGHLRTHGFEVDLFDLHNFPHTAKGLYKSICQNDIAMVGFSVCADSLYDVVRMASKIKVLVPNAIIVLGGPHASVDYRNILLHHPQIDLISIGAGEETILQILDYISHTSEPYDWSKINNIAYVSNERNVEVSEWVERDISRVGIPDYSDYIGRYGGIPSICTARGCAFRCAFCALNVEPKVRWKCRSKKNIDDELLILSKEFSIKVLDITDADFFTSPAHTEMVVDLLSDIQQIEEVHISCRVDSLLRSWSLFERMIERFVVNLELGIEAYSQRQLDRYNKKITSSQIDEVVAKLKGCNPTRVKVQFDFILFDPYVAKEEIRAVIMFMRNNGFDYAKHEDVLFSKMHLLPNTKIRDMAVKDGLAMLNDVYTPYWRFKNRDVALLYSYVSRYKEFLLPKLQEARQNINKYKNNSQCKQAGVLRTVKFISRCSFLFLEDMLQCVNYEELENTYNMYREKILYECEEIGKAC